MRVLFTGASSFTGFWFVRELARAGHEVVATFRTPPASYQGVRAQRVGQLGDACRQVVCTFGDAAFLDLAATGPWDLFCHHAADVTNYKSPDFDVTAALGNNTRNLPGVLAALQAAGGSRVLLTGSVFECDEGEGEVPRRAFSPYGLSKALTAQVFLYHAQVLGLRLGKFVIPNPFGPFEEPRFTTFLARSWFEGKAPTVATPDYVRDNIHVSLLAGAYRQFAEQLPASPGLSRLNPSGYAGSQGEFTQRFAAAMGPRLGLACPFELGVQRDFSEPRVRINTDAPDAAALGWDEGKAWDELAAYYVRTFGGTPKGR